MAVVVDVVRGEVLRGNPLGDPAERRLPVYLPPGYEASADKYPVIYFLAGFGGGGVYGLGETLWEENIPQRVERLIAAGAIRPLIVVLVDCTTRLGGSQYINSTATGRYEDHVVQEIVAHVDARYRTRADREQRIVMGHSSGGYGATVLAMRHPDVFGIAVDHAGDKYFELCYRRDFPPAVAALARYEHSAARFLAGFPHPPAERGGDWFALVSMLAMASCYSPDPAAPLGFALPFDEYTAELEREVWECWLAHDPVELVAAHAAALRSLRLYFLDCGRRDEYHLQYGARVYRQRLRSHGIPHVYEEFDGGHRHTGYRFDVSLRAVSAAL